MLTWYEQTYGALVTDEPIEGITEELSPLSRGVYGAKYFIAESMSLSAAKEISRLLKLQFMGVIRPFGS